MDDGTVTIFSQDENKMTKTVLQGQHSISIWDVNFAPDGRLFASIDLQGGFTIWSTEVPISIPVPVDHAPVFTLFIHF